MAASSVENEVWLEVRGGEEALGRGMQRALIDRACSRTPPQLRVRPSGIPQGGLGLFADRSFEAGEAVLELYGVLVPRKARYDRPGSQDYIFGLNEAFRVDPLHPQVQSHQWCLSWAINHSCNPNLVALKSTYGRLGFSRQEAAFMRQPLVQQEPVGHADPEDDELMDELIFFVALKPIGIGDELFFDYRRGAVCAEKESDGTHRSSIAKICRCASPQCRGWY